MSRDFFNTLADEVDSLLAAGSAAAATDQRLPKRAATLRQLARQVPRLTPWPTPSAKFAGPQRRSRAGPCSTWCCWSGRVRVGTGAEALKGEVVPLPVSGPWVSDLPTEEVHRMVQSVRLRPRQRGPGRAAGAQRPAPGAAGDAVLGPAGRRGRLWSSNSTAGERKGTGRR